MMSVSESQPGGWYFAIDPIQHGFAAFYRDTTHPPPPFATPGVARVDDSEDDDWWGEVSFSETSSQVSDGTSEVGCVCVCV